MTDNMRKLQKVSVVVRSHKFERLLFLKRALLSLAIQKSVAVEAIVVLQDFSEEAVASVDEALRLCLPFVGDTMDLVIQNVKLENGESDIRGRLLNVGIGLASGDFLAFLDDDDLMYHFAYERLSAELLKGNAAVAVGRCVQVQGELVDGAFLASKKHRPYVGRSLVELICDNFCPIHSFLVDLRKVQKTDLRIDEDFPYLEDYRLLLRLASKYQFSFDNMKRDICEYWFYDNVNTTNLRSDPYGSVAHGWRKAYVATQELKATLTFPVSLIDIEMWCRRELGELANRRRPAAIFSPPNPETIAVVFEKKGELRLHTGTALSEAQ